ncbi:MAG: isoaspartyl peptidase/L-asparaginase family protein [Betaproteobacteria bacterium]
MKWSLAVHGGAGDWKSVKHRAALDGVRAAASAGAALLESGASALDAVCAVVVALENDPLFNAGTGGVLNRLGEAELDASVMRGTDLAFGGVGAIARVRNPVLIARAVMEHSGHALLVGEGARQFARAQGFEDYDPISAQARVDYQDKQASAGLGTVGAVALDAEGCWASATSTGGVALKLPGRIGDSPLPGAGTYATRGAAVSATGQGELIMRVLAAKSISDLIVGGMHAQAAVESVLQSMRDTVGAGAGFIAIGANGTIGIAHDTLHMVHGWGSSESPRVEVRMRVGDSAG